MLSNFSLFRLVRRFYAQLPIYCQQCCPLKVEYFGEEFEDTKGVIRIRKSKKNRQHNGQKKKDKRTNNDLQNIQTKLKIE